MEENENIEFSYKSMFTPICITQIICVFAIVISILIMKFFFVKTFSTFEKWYQDNVLDQTVVTDFIDEEEAI